MRVALLARRRNHSTSIGAPRSSLSRPAFSRTVEWRPSQPTTRSARIVSVPSGVFARSPTIRPPSSIEVRRLGLHAQVESLVALALLREEVEEVPLRHQGDEFAVRWQMAEIGRSEDARRRPDRIASRPSDAAASGTHPAGPVRTSTQGSRDAPCRRGNRAGNRRVFPARATSTPARASRNPSIIPAGPPPAMQHCVVIVKSAIPNHMWTSTEIPGAVVLSEGGMTRILYN